MHDKFSFVEVPKEMVRKVVTAMKKAKIKGKPIHIEPANEKRSERS